MAKNSGKLGKFSSALGRSFTFRKFGHSAATATSTAASESSVTVDSPDDEQSESSVAAALGYQTVYVGKCRRAYQISSQVIEHPSFQGLISRSKSDGCDDDSSAITLACEVVLFEHLLWILQSIDPQTESLDELFAFYA